MGAKTYTTIDHFLEVYAMSSNLNIDNVKNLRNKG